MFTFVSPLSPLRLSSLLPSSLLLFPSFSLSFTNHSSILYSLSPRSRLPLTSSPPPFSLNFPLPLYYLLINCVRSAKNIFLVVCMARNILLKVNVFICWTSRKTASAEWRAPVGWHSDRVVFPGLRSYMIFSSENKKTKMALADRVDILSAQASTVHEAGVCLENRGARGFTWTRKFHDTVL